MLDVWPPLQEDAAQVGPGLPLSGLGRCLRCPKASQKAVGTYSQAPAYLLGHHMGFLDNPRATSMWGLLQATFPTGHVEQKLESQHQSALRGLKMPFRRVTCRDCWSQGCEQSSIPKAVPAPVIGH